MARIVCGCRGATWRAPEWVVRNFGSELVTILSTMRGGPYLAQRWSEAFDRESATIDLTAILENGTVRETWLAALDATLASFAIEDPLQWNDPNLYAPFMGSIRFFVDTEHARPSMQGLITGPEANDAIGTSSELAWIFDDRLDR